MAMRPVFVLLLLVRVCAGAEASGTLENTGQPMRVPFECKPDVLQSLGLSCAEDDPCAVYLELAAVDSNGVRVVVAGNLHTSTVTLSSILLASADGGKTWTEPYDRIPLAELEQIQFIGLDRGWISGSIVQPLPRDPFFLLTTDGGKGWKRQPLFEDMQQGSIEKFWFDSPKSGALIMTVGEGKYELLESMTGGESWALRQTSPTALKLEHSGAGNAGWRLRIDAKTHAYDVETRQAGAWQRVASFLVTVGTCK